MFVRVCHENLMNLCLDCNCFVGEQLEQQAEETKQNSENDKLEV